MRKPFLAVVTAAATLASMLGAAPAAPGRRPATNRAVGGRDTVATNRGTIRLIGIDTPERDKCGCEAATQLASRVTPPGSVIRLTNQLRNGLRRARQLASPSPAITATGSPVGRRRCHHRSPDGPQLAPKAVRHTGWFRRTRTEARCIPPTKTQWTLAVLESAKRVRPNAGACAAVRPRRTAVGRAQS